MLAKALAHLIGISHPPLEASALREAVRISTRTGATEREFAAFLTNFSPRDQRRLKRYVNKVSRVLGRLMVSNSGAATMEDHLDWMEVRLLQHFPELDEETIKATRTYCYWSWR